MYYMGVLDCQSDLREREWNLIDAVEVETNTQDFVQSRQNTDWKIKKIKNHGIGVTVANVKIE